MPRRPLLHALYLALSRPPISFFKKGTSDADIAGNLIMQNPNRTLLIEHKICTSAAEGLFE
jgi:hypothetical protein